jgi:hypothetical protein
VVGVSGVSDVLLDVLQKPFSVLQLSLSVLHFSSVFPSFLGVANLSKYKHIDNISELEIK